MNAAQIDSLMAMYPPALLECLTNPPQIVAAEFGDAVAELVLAALQVHDGLARAVPEEQDAPTVVGCLLGAWTMQLDLAGLRPLVSVEPRPVIVGGTEVSGLGPLLDERLPPWHRSPLAVLIFAVQLVLQVAPDAAREEQAAGVALLLRQLEGWLPPGLCAH